MYLSVSRHHFFLQFEELVEKENLIEHNLPSTISLQDISDNEEVWMIQIPKKVCIYKKDFIFKLYLKMQSHLYVIVKLSGTIANKNDLKNQFTDNFS